MEPPFQETYMNLLQNNQDDDNNLWKVDEECLLPLIDLNCLNSGKAEHEKCADDIAQAASEWGFFQIVNHGIPLELIANIHKEEKKCFYQSFSKKVQENFLNLSADSYRWGNPTATRPSQFPWSEAIHISLSDISNMSESKSLRWTQVYVKEVGNLAQRLCEVLAKKVNIKQSYFNCEIGSSYLRMNRYPICPFSSKVFGLMPHTDSDFLSVVSQDQIGGLQLKKDGRWFNIKPSPQALVINIGDLFQALSNGVYKSLEHRVVAPENKERFSVAFFFCPSQDTIIRSRMYRSFSFREYKLQIQSDVETTGDKVGLSRFLK